MSDNVQFGDDAAAWRRLVGAAGERNEKVGHLADLGEGAKDVTDLQQRRVHTLNKTFGARPRLPKEALEVYAAEITRLVQEAFPGYGDAAIMMECFRCFVAGLDPVLQTKCHENGATSLEEALMIASQWEKSQEAMKPRNPTPLVSMTTNPSGQVSCAAATPGPSNDKAVQTDDIWLPEEQPTGQPSLTTALLSEEKPIKNYNKAVQTDISIPTGQPSCSNGPSKNRGLVIGLVAGAGISVVLAPIALAGIGFTATGIAAGSIAASMMSSAAVANGGAIAAGSLVACLQSAGAVGLSGVASAAVGTAGATVGGAVGWLASKFKRS